MIESIVTSAALAVVMVVCGLLVWAENYEDEVIGRLGLGGMSGAAFITLLATANGSPLEVPPLVVVFIVSVAIFMARHAYRFVRFSCDGRYSWKRRGST